MVEEVLVNICRSIEPELVEIYIFSRVNINKNIKGNAISL